jgi:hypothetical protein
MYSYYLIFCSYEGDWKTRILKKGFGHLFVLLKEGETWMLLDPDCRRLTVKPITAGWCPVVMKKFCKKYKVLRIECDCKSERKILNFWRPFTCLEIVKYICGLKLLCFTPYQLFKRLKNLSKNNLMKNNIRCVTEIKEEEKWAEDSQVLKNR